MLKNYFKVALRNLKKNKFYSSINISGLAVGMAATMIIGLWIFDELSYNRHFENYDTIAQIYQHQTNNGEVGTGEAIPRPLEFALREDYKDNFKHIIMSSWNFPWYLKYQDKNLSFSGSFMQEGAIDMLSINVIKGQQNGIVEKNSIMIAESTAESLFGEEDPIGKILSLSDSFEMKITSVYEDIPNNNDFSDLEFIMPWKHYVTWQEWITNAEDNWGNNSFRLFVEINENTSMKDVTEKIIDVKKNKSEDTAEFNPQIFLVPMKDWHLRSSFENGVQTGGRIENVWLFGIIGLFVLLLACINFINLSTARSEKRATEVGIRKSVGSQRGQLIFQFLSESFLIVFISFLLAIGIVLVSLNGFNNLAAKEIVFPWANFQFWIAAVVFILTTAVLAGSYPALYLSSFNPVSVLKGTFRAGRFSALPRKILVVTQFTVSIALIIGTIVVINQIQYSKDRPVGYDKESLVQVPVMSAEFIGKADLMRDRLIESGAIVEMCTTSSPTTNVWSNRSGYTWEGK
ncbi:MAG: ABC transporter permease, partial [Bacteroidota bacterium]